MPTELTSTDLRSVQFRLEALASSLRMALLEEHQRRIACANGMLETWTRAITDDTKEAWVEAAKAAQFVIEHSGLSSIEFGLACRIKELSGQKAG